MYSSEYVKFDSDKVERTKSFKKENPVYKKPEQKLENETVTQVGCRKRLQIDSEVISFN